MRVKEWITAHGSYDAVIEYVLDATPSNPTYEGAPARLIAFVSSVTGAADPVVRAICTSGLEATACRSGMTRLLDAHGPEAVEALLSFETRATEFMVDMGLVDDEQEAREALEGWTADIFDSEAYGPYSHETQAAHAVMNYFYPMHARGE